jgi:hypothetical protein
MPRRPRCALLVFASVRVLTQPFAEQAGIGTMLQRGCDHLVTAIFTSSEIQDIERLELADLPKPNIRIRRCLIEVKESPWASPSSPLILAALRSASQPGHPAFG